MTSLPWDDWFYHLSKKHRELDSDYNKYLKLRDDIGIQGDDFNDKLDRYQSLLIYNTSLMISFQSATFSKSDYHQWLKDSETNKPSHSLDRSAVVTGLRDANELLGIAFSTVAIQRFGSKLVLPALKKVWAATKKIFQATEEGAKLLEDGGIEMVDYGALDSGVEVSEDLITGSVDEVAAEAVAEAGTRFADGLIGEGVAESVTVGIFSKLSLSAMSNLTLGLSIVAVVGIDAILGAIQGSKESKELNHAIDRMNTALGKTQNFKDALGTKMSKLDGFIESEKKTLVKTIALLTNIHSFKSVNERLEQLLDKKGNAPITDYVIAAKEAVQQYGIFTRIRNDADLYIRNKGEKASYEEFKSIEAMFLDHKIFTLEELGKFIDYVSQYDEDLKKLKDKKTTPPNTESKVARPHIKVMGIFDGLFYPGIKKLEKQIHTLKGQYTTARKHADTVHQDLRVMVDNLKSMNAYAATLLMDVVALKATDDDFKKYIDQVKNGIDMPHDGKTFIPADAAKTISEAAGGYFALKLVYNIGKLIKSGLMKDTLADAGEIELQETAYSVGADAGALGISEGVGEVAGEAGGEIAAEAIGEAAAEAGVEAGVSMALPGLGLIAALGIDAIASIFTGRKRENKLKKAKRKLQDALNKVDAYNAKVDALIATTGKSIVKEEKQFLAIVQSLAEAQEPHFNYALTPGVKNTKLFLDAMKQAVQQYGMLVKARELYMSNKDANGNVDWKALETALVSVRPRGTTVHFVQQIVAVLRESLKWRSYTALIKSVAFPGRYLRGINPPKTPQGAGGGEVNVQYGAGPNEHWIVNPIGRSNEYSLKNKQGGFLRGDNTAVNLQAYVGSHEKWELVDSKEQDGTVYIKNIEFGNFLCLDGRSITKSLAPGGGEVNLKPAIGPWEKFIIEKA
ncbi:hypothetical protein AAMO2058_001534100 [Amorphochlora amoebiformis]